MSFSAPKLIIALLVVLGVLVAAITYLFQSSQSSHPKSESVIDTASAVDTPVSQYVTANGKSLYLNGETYQFTGVNAFNLATYPGANAGCGSFVEDLDGFFSQLRPNSAVRMWAFQGSIATNVTSKEIDWTGLDRVVNAAQRNGKKLILVLGDQSGHCDDGHWKDKSWYEGGYTQAYNDYGNNLTPLPYLDYIKLIVARYKDSSTVAMWEPVNEPSAANCAGNFKGYDCYAHQSCPDESSAANAQRSFFDAVGGVIKGIDSHHLISSGVIGDGQCGAVYEDYKFIHESPGIDVASYHDYHRDDQPMPGDAWNGLQKRLDQMSLINKPLIIGEVGMLAAGSSSSCISYNSRRDSFKAKMDAQFPAGIAGYIPWALMGGTSQGCNYDIVGSDPTIDLLRDYQVSMSGTFPPSTDPPFPDPVPVVPDTEAPTAPENMSATGITGSQATIKWNASTDNIGVLRYELYRNSVYLTSTTGTSQVNTTLSPGTNYTYYIKARDLAGNTSLSSAMLSITTPGGTPPPPPTPPVVDMESPTAPQNLTATGLSSTHVTINWDASTDDVGIVRYEVYRNSAYLTSTPETNQYNSTLSAGMNYTYYVKARDAAGNTSPSSPMLTITTPGGIAPPPAPTPPPPVVDSQAPTAPQNINATGLSATQVTLNWTASTDIVGVVRYDLYRSSTYLTSTTGTSQVNTNLTAGNTYTYYVKAKDAAGNTSSSSNILSITTPGGTPPPPPPPPPVVDTQAPTTPNGLNATGLSSTQVTINWNASSDNVGVARYEVYRNSTYLTSTTNTNQVNTNLTPGVSYSYYIKAKDAAGNTSPSSSMLIVTTPVPDTQRPSAPTNLTVVVNSPTGATLTWDASTDNIIVVRYDVYRNTNFIISTKATSQIITTLSPGSSYIFYVKSQDAAGNYSLSSNTVAVTTPAAEP